MTCTYAFSRAWPRLRAFASNSDWLIALFVDVMIGYSIETVCFALGIE